jgi:hypothetical protein
MSYVCFATMWTASSPLQKKTVRLNRMIPRAENFCACVARELFNFFICVGGGFGIFVREIFLLYKKNFEMAGDTGSLREEGIF